MLNVCRSCAKPFICLIWVNPHTILQGIIYYYRHFRVEAAESQDCAANNWQTWHLNQDNLALESELSTTKLHHLSFTISWCQVPSFSSVTLRNPWVTNRGYLVLGLLEIPCCLSVQWLGLGHLQPSFKMDNLNKAYIREELCWGHFTVSLEFQYPPNIIL